ncbi:hypothetical protein F8388_020818 [Cannabis sativa]|uniref:TOD1/MUCI70 glycosyltransferase-like domain-containing protein n=1 Tax=Cannabis sativa TaxID=3483 RepID=A0A7J6FK59_CANSA|nr:hypothetical protein F8388_020818 [Cannabis sativa]KAF4383379.1 hypothetical protein G4B88_023953 [Cannabis sativa]
MVSNTQRIQDLERRIGELDGLDERVRDLAPNNQNSGPTVTQQQVASLAQDYANLLARVAAIERRDAATETSGAPQMEDRIKALEQAIADMQAAITVLQNGQAALQDSLKDTIEDCNVSVTAIREELAGISSSKSDAATGKKPLKCWLCQGPHRAAACPHQSKLSAIKASIAQEEQGCGEDDEDEDCAHMSTQVPHVPPTWGCPNRRTVTEGIEQNPIVYDLMSEMAFLHKKVDVKKHINSSKKAVLVEFYIVHSFYMDQTIVFDIYNVLSLEHCKIILLLSLDFCIFSWLQLTPLLGNYDIVQQPKNVSDLARKNVPFYMFIDEETETYLKNSSVLESDTKASTARIFPNVRYSIRIDGKLELVLDPYQILESFE